MIPALRVEWWKTRGSRVTLVATILMGLGLPAMGLGFYSVAMSGGNGVLADKAKAFLTAPGWEGYFGLVDQIAAVAVFLGAGVVVIWAFGREHIDRTFSSLYALPVSRPAIAGAKFVVLSGWILVLSVAIVGFTLGFGIVGGIGPVEGLSFGMATRTFAVASGAALLSLPLGWVASVGRGYLSGITVLIVIIAVAQVAVLMGAGGWFPFAVPGLLAISGSEGVPDLTVFHLVLVPLVVLLGISLTLEWWRRAEVV